MVRGQGIESSKNSSIRVDRPRTGESSLFHRLLYTKFFFLMNTNLIDETQNLKTFRVDF